MVEQGEVSEVASTADLFDTGDRVRGYRLRETFTLQRICDDLESHGYTVQPVLIPACAVGAPHRRDRVFIIGHRRDAISGNTDGSWAELSEKREVPTRSTTESGRVRKDGSGTALADSEHLRLQHDAKRGKQAGDAQKKSRGRKDRISEPVQRSAADGERRNTADPYREMLERWFDGDSERYGQGQDGPIRHFRASTLAGCGHWQGFPTVSPVHRGNDGLPFDMDDLTIPFSKWRTEALKAYGNAIVPQVMYEIFRAIDQIEHQ